MIIRYSITVIVIMLLLPTVLPSQEKDKKDKEENPHTAMVGDEFTCLDCHTEVPKEGKTSPTYFLVDEPSEVCLGCHDESTHPGSKVHIEQIAKPLPGDQNGKIACFTCHDPHPEGVIKGRKVYGADLSPRSMKFLRLVVSPELAKELGTPVKLDTDKEVYLREPMNTICSTCHKTIKYRGVYTPWFKFSEMFTY
ncbi:MAG: cytochrome c3 family protein [Thermodesulfobacteriota bacterium]